MPIDDDRPLESPQDRAKRIWQNYAVEKSFKDQRKAISNPPPTPEQSEPAIATAIKSDEFKRAKIEKRVNKIRQEVLSPIIEGLKESYENTIRAQHGLIAKLLAENDPNRKYRQLLIQKLKLLQERERRGLR